LQDSRDAADYQSCGLVARGSRGLTRIAGEVGFTRILPDCVIHADSAGLRHSRGFCRVFRRRLVCFDGFSRFTRIASRRFLPDSRIQLKVQRFTIKESFSFRVSVLRKIHDSVSRQSQPNFSQVQQILEDSADHGFADLAIHEFDEFTQHSACDSRNSGS
jgi:hypothetical protein